MRTIPHLPTHNKTVRLTVTAFLLTGSILASVGCRKSLTSAPDPVPVSSRTTPTKSSATNVRPSTGVPTATGSAAANMPTIGSGYPGNSVLARWQPKPRLFIATHQTSTQVALTFDAGADANAVPLLLKTLKQHHVHATFFLTGKFCEGFPKQCRAIADAGMEIGNHSYSHPSFLRISDANIRLQIKRGEEQIVKTCGRSAKPLFRFPYGDCDARTQRVVAEAGYQSIGWGVDSLDAYLTRKTADFVAARIMKRIKPGQITLMHVSCVTSAQALPRIFDYLDKKGITVVPVSTLMTEAKQPAPRVMSAKSAAYRAIKPPGMVK